MALAIWNYGSDDDQRWASSASAFAGLASVFQLRASGWFEKFAGHYGDIEKYPWGPPSHITQQLIKQQERSPLRSRFRHVFFSRPDLGAAFGIFSIILGLIATWL